MAKQIEVLLTVPFSDEIMNQLKGSVSGIKIRHYPARQIEDVPAEILSKAEVLYTDRVLPLPEQVPNLKWIQFHVAGLDFATNHILLQNDNLLITTISGTSASQAAEYAVMMMLALGHKLPEMLSMQKLHEWPRDRWDRYSPLELRTSTVGLVGYGSIGRQIARLLQPFGTKILAVKRDVMHPEDSDYMPDGMGDRGGDYFHRLYPNQAIQSMIKECDFIVVCTPLTSQTKHLIGDQELSVCKPTTFIINISRGDIIDQDALVKALEEKHIAGAALDVFHQEPLPQDHILWTLPNVIISPHIAGNSRFYNDRAMTFFIENLKRFISGDALMNRYHQEKEY